MEKGFYHKDRGYWQVTGEVPDHIRQSYPAGTIEVPVKPGDGYEFNGVSWVPPSKEEERLAAAHKLRRQRDELLADSDWIVTKAVEQNAQDGLGIQVPQVWLDYRQALRYIPHQPGFPDSVTWPTAP